MRDLIPIEKWDSLHYWSRLEDDPPIFTWKEFKALFEEWRGNPTKATLGKLINSHADKLETNMAIVAKDLFGMIIAYREQLLGGTAGSGLEIELVERVKTSDVCLSMMKISISELPGFSGGSPLASKNAVEILDELKPRDTLRGPMKKEAQVLMDGLVDELIPAVVGELRDRFTRKDGIDSLWGHDRHTVEKWVLFRRDGGFYPQDGLEFLRVIVGRAKTDIVIHANLFQFVLMRGHALRHGLKALCQSELHLLASDKEIIPLIWQGVVSNRLQPRMIGSLKETRAQLVELLGSEELLPVPEWWDKASQETSG